jgi:hypothetical protein
MMSLVHRLGIVWVFAIATGCGAAAVPHPWEVEPTAVGGLYEYPEEAHVYAPGDRGAYYVVARDDSPAGRRALHAMLAALGPVDATGRGFVIRLDEDAWARVAGAPEVGSAAPLVAAARRGPIGTGQVAVAIDLFDDATPAEVDAVATWLTARGATIAGRTTTAITATVSAEIAVEAARLGPVRWVAARTDDGTASPPGPVPEGDGASR